MNHNQTNNEIHNQIEDIIESRSDIGQYDMLSSELKQPNLMPPPLSARFTYSAPGNSRTEDARDSIYSRNVEGILDLRLLDLGNSIGPTDSEITLCRVKQENSHVKRTKVNNWDVMHDTAIPGDGTHLGDSPSMVNLVTFVVQTDGGIKAQGKSIEFMVPLSSWEPQSASLTPQSVTVINPIIESPRNNSNSSQMEMADVVEHIRSNDSEQLLATSESERSTNKPKKTSSVKDILKRMAFWRRKSRDSISDNNSVT